MYKKVPIGSAQIEISRFNCDWLLTYISNNSINTNLHNHLLRIKWHSCMPKFNLIIWICIKIKILHHLHLYDWKTDSKIWKEQNIEKKIIILHLDSYQASNFIKFYYSIYPQKPIECWLIILCALNYFKRFFFSIFWYLFSS